MSQASENPGLNLRSPDWMRRNYLAFVSRHQPPGERQQFEGIAAEVRRESETRFNSSRFQGTGQRRSESRRDLALLAQAPEVANEFYVFSVTETVAPTNRGVSARAYILSQAGIQQESRGACTQVAIKFRPLLASEFVSEMQRAVLALVRGHIGSESNYEIPFQGAAVTFRMDPESGNLMHENRAVGLDPELGNGVGFSNMGILKPEPQRRWRLFHYNVSHEHLDRLETWRATLRLFSDTGLPLRGLHFGSQAADTKPIPLEKITGSGYTVSLTPNKISGEAGRSYQWNSAFIFLPVDQARFRGRRDEFCVDRNVAREVFRSIDGSGSLEEQALHKLGPRAMEPGGSFFIAASKGWAHHEQTIISFSQLLTVVHLSSAVCPLSFTDAPAESNGLWWPRAMMVVFGCRQRASLSSGETRQMVAIAEVMSQPSRTKHRKQRSF